MISPQVVEESRLNWGLWSSIPTRALPFTGNACLVSCCDSHKTRDLFVLDERNCSQVALLSCAASDLAELVAKLQRLSVVFSLFLNTCFECVPSNSLRRYFLS